MELSDIERQSLEQTTDDPSSQQIGGELGGLTGRERQVAQLKKINPKRGKALGQHMWATREKEGRVGSGKGQEFFKGTHTFEPMEITANPPPIDIETLKKILADD